SGVTATTYTDTGLANGQQYVYKVAGVDFTGEGNAATLLSVTPHIAVVNRAIFHNHSYWNDPANGFTNDDNAIDPSKTALLPGGTGSFANYTGSSLGINGIMIDLSGLPAGTPTAADFTFKVGNDSNLGLWTAP